MPKRKPSLRNDVLREPPAAYGGEIVLYQAPDGSVKLDVRLVSTLADRRALSGDKAAGLLRVVRDYAFALGVIDDYDHDRIPPPAVAAEAAEPLSLEEARRMISEMKKRYGGGALFGKEQGERLAGPLAGICQSAAGRDAYPTIPAKAAHLLYFLVKDHPFVDGNKRIGAAPSDPAVTLLESHELIYFLQAADPPLRLRCVKTPWGVYAENVRHLLRTIESRLAVGGTDGGDAPDEPLRLVGGAARDAETFLASHPATLECFDQVVRLVEGYETPFGLELFANMHWVVAKESARESEEIAERVRAWNQRKRQFTPAQIELAAQRLRGQRRMDG